MKNELVEFESTYQFSEDGNECIAIDGFPADDGEGEVVAQVWCTPHKDIVIDWHNNAYRGNKTVLSLIEDSKERLLKEEEE